MPLTLGPNPRATEVIGLVNDWYVTDAGTPYGNPAIAPGRQLCVYGQTANTAARTVPNQMVGTFAIPAGTTNGATISVPNTLVGAATSQVFFQLKDDDSGNIQRVVGPTTITDRIGFAVKVVCGAAVTTATDVQYWIVN